MANLTNNRISVTLETDVLRKVQASLTEVNNLLPFLTGLTTEERMKLPKIDGSNRLFVQDTLKVMKQNGAIMPNFVSIEELEKDFILYEQLDAVLSAVN